MNSKSYIHTNAKVFYKIAQEAYIEMKEAYNSNRKPISGDSPGWIITYDPNQKSFKKALITIVFCGICLEAILHQLIVEFKGIEFYTKKVDSEIYENKLNLLGCNDMSIIERCKHLRRARKDIIHEKAHLKDDGILFAQTEAQKSIEILNSI